MLGGNPIKEILSEKKPKLILNSLRECSLIKVRLLNYSKRLPVKTPLNNLKLVKYF